MAENLQQHLVGLGRVGLGAQALSELGLYRGEGGFGVGAQVVVSQELFSVEVVIVPQPAPQG